MPRRPAPGALACALVLLAGCSASGDGGARDSLSTPAAEAPMDEAVRAVLTVERTSVAPGDSIPLALTVVNATPDSVVLEFTSGQRYDIRVLRPDGATTWTWSMDKLFAQMMGTETIAPGDTLEFRDAAPAPAEPGTYRVAAEVTASNRDLADTVEVTVGR